MAGNNVPGSNKWGGRAFPLAVHDPADGSTQYSEGMTLRDWFAGQALIGIVAPDDGFSLPPEDCAEWAYQYADAMIAERGK